MEEMFGNVIETFLGSQGWMVQVLSIVGLLRLVVKPIMEVVQAYVKWTATPKDDSLVNHILTSPIYTKFLFVLDWLTSIKIKK